MRIHHRFNLAASALTVLASLFLVSCESSERKPPTSPVTEIVYVVFEGPWAIVPDPNDTSSVLAIAPKTKAHRALSVTPANLELDAGVYELTVPSHGAPAPLDLDKGFFRISIDPKNVQHAVGEKNERYAIRLPKPETYKAETRYPSRVATSYPPPPSAQQNYVTAVSLVYRVTSKTGFSVSGEKDAGGRFGPSLLDLETPTVRFAIEPAGENLSADSCHTHSRQAFHDLVKLLDLTLYDDFPESPDKCHKNDPQALRSEKALMPSSHTSGPLFANYSGRNIPLGILAVFYFFHAEGGACFAAIIFGI